MQTDLEEKIQQETMIPGRGRPRVENQDPRSGHLVSAPSASQVTASTRAPSLRPSSLIHVTVRYRLMVVRLLHDLLLGVP